MLHALVRNRLARPNPRGVDYADDSLPTIDSASASLPGNGVPRLCQLPSLAIVAVGGGEDGGNGELPIMLAGRGRADASRLVTTRLGPQPRSVLAERTALFYLDPPSSTGPNGPSPLARPQDQSPKVLAPTLSVRRLDSTTHSCHTGVTGVIASNPRGQPTAAARRVTC